MSEKPDSHEICFVADGDHAEFLEQHGVAKASGAIRDVAGRVVGTHDGVHRFTVGQRKGLGLSSPVRLYVVGIDAEQGAVTVGPREALERGELTASGVNWIAGAPPAAGTRATAQIRHRHREAAVSITALDGGRVHAAFDEPQYAVAPGQAVVFYDGEVVWAEGGSTDLRAGLSRSGVSSRVQFRLAQVLGHAFQVFLGVDRRHAA